MYSNVELRNMRFYIQLFSCFLLLSCGRVINPLNRTPKAQETARFNPFSLATHIVTGNCQQPPIKHRTIIFSPIILEKNDEDIFIGTLDIALYQDTNTYDALYREWPGASNVDQTKYEIKFSGGYYFEPPQIENTSDNLILENLGLIIPTLDTEKIKFILRFNNSINRTITNSKISGYGRMASSPLFEDNCP